MIAINPLSLISREELSERMVQFVATIKASPMWDDTREMLLPGELEYRMAVERRAKGIPLPPNLFDELNELGAELDLDRILIAREV